MPVYTMFDEVDVIGLIDMVLGWDLSDEALPDALQAQIAGTHAE